MFWSSITCWMVNIGSQQPIGDVAKVDCDRPTVGIEPASYWAIAHRAILSRIPRSWPRSARRCVFAKGRDFGAWLGLCAMRLPAKRSCRHRCPRSGQAAGPALACSPMSSSRNTLTGCRPIDRARSMRGRTSFITGLLRLRQQPARGAVEQTAAIRWLGCSRRV